MRTVDRYGKAPAAATGFLLSLRPLRTGFIAAFSFIASGLVESRKARAATELHRQLSRMSNAELAFRALGLGMIIPLR